MKSSKDLPQRSRVSAGPRFRLAKIDPRDTAGLRKSEGEKRLARCTERLAELQDRLYAQDRWALLVILQGMDAAGKDGLLKHVLSSVNPAGCQVFAFKAPSVEELDHDFLWRAACRLPERGRIGLFNRSYYEEVVTVRVHPEFLEKQHLPERLVDDDLWNRRYEDIQGFERYLARNGVLIRKFFLHVSREEQKKRFLERIDRPEKHWKFNRADVVERGHWDLYQRYWSEAVGRTSAEHAPWHVVPADRKWFARLLVAETLVEALEGLELDFPRVDAERLGELEEARAALNEEGGAPRRPAR